MGVDDRSELLRIAYGAGSTDDERTAAAQALARLDAEASAAIAEPDDAYGGPRGAQGASSRTAGPDDAPFTRPRTVAGIIDAVGARAVAISVTSAVAAAVLLGSSLAPVAGAVPDRLVTALSAEEYDVATARATQIFTRSGSITDLPRVHVPEQWGIAMESIRNLRSSIDGVKIFGAKTAALHDACVIVTFKDQIAHGCTDDGRFPADGLTATVIAPDGVAGARVTWHADASLSAIASTG